MTKVTQLIKYDQACSALSGLRQRYENKRPMPSWMFEKFCNITGVDRHWLVFGYKRRTILRGAG